MSLPQAVRPAKAVQYHSTVRNPLERRFLNPRSLLVLVVALLAVIVQSGELGSADTTFRLQTAHSFWTSEPAVYPSQYPEFGVHGRGGKLYDWYGIGQPLLMLPADIVGTWIENLPIFDDYRGNDPGVRAMFVAFTINILISVLTALVCLRFLQLLGFSLRLSVAGVLALFFCTTHLHYTQNMMENNYIFLLSLAGFLYQYEWLRTRKVAALIIGSAAFGLNLLTRLTTGLDLLAGGGFLLIVLLLERVGKQEIYRRLFTYLKVAAPIYALFLFFDRLYQYHRFGTWTDTYVRYFTIEHRLHDPALPAKYPWETPFHAGFLGALFAPDKSIFQFDPLIILILLLTVVLWKRLSPPVKAYVVTSLLLVLAYICLYARYTVWSGDFAWGDRYVSTAAEMAAFISVPLLFKYRRQLSATVWVTGVTLIVAGLVIQLASLAFWLPLEIYQADDFGRPQWTILLRFKNIVAFALGKMDAWRLNTDSMTYDHWDYLHITTWNFLPFVLRRMGNASRWVVDLVTGLWVTGVVLFGMAAARLLKLLGSCEIA